MGWDNAHNLENRFVDQSLMQEFFGAMKERAVATNQFGNFTDFTEYAGPADNSQFIKRTGYDNQFGAVESGLTRIASYFYLVDQEVGVKGSSMTQYGIFKYLYDNACLLGFPRDVEYGLDTRQNLAMKKSILRNTDYNFTDQNVWGVIERNNTILEITGGENVVTGQYVVLDYGNGWLDLKTSCFVDGNGRPISADITIYSLDPVTGDPKDPPPSGQITMFGGYGDIIPGVSEVEITAEQYTDTVNLGTYIVLALTPFGVMIDSDARKDYGVTVPDHNVYERYWQASYRYVDIRINGIEITDLKVPCSLVNPRWYEHFIEDRNGQHAPRQEMFVNADYMQQLKTRLDFSIWHEVRTTGDCTWTGGEISTGDNSASTEDGTIDNWYNNPGYTRVDEYPQRWVGCYIHCLSRYQTDFYDVYSASGYNRDCVSVAKVLGNIQGDAAIIGMGLHIYAQTYVMEYFGDNYGFEGHMPNWTFGYGSGFDEESPTFAEMKAFGTPAVTVEQDWQSSGQIIVTFGGTCSPIPVDGFDYVTLTYAGPTMKTWHIHPPSTTLNRELSIYGTNQILLKRAFEFADPLE